MTVHVCGIDIGKTVFHLIGLSKEGHIVVKKRLTRKQFITHTVNMRCDSHFPSRRRLRVLTRFARRFTDG